VGLFKRNDKPILAVDIDGVISLFGFEGKEAHEVGSEPPRGEFHLVDGMLHCISRPAGQRLSRLSGTYDMIWCSGWEDRANDHLPQILGLPKLPYLTFDGRAQFGTAHWKLGPLEEYARDRPLAWIDDSLDRSCYEWAEERKEPTLLVPTDPEIGLEEAHLAALESWAADLSAKRD
jgi:hypothetical protein